MKVRENEREKGGKRDEEMEREREMKGGRMRERDTWREGLTVLTFFNATSSSIKLLYHLLLERATGGIRVELC